MSNIRDGYDWWPQQGMRQMFLCHACGAAVADADAHDEWHAAVIKTLTTLESLIAYARKPDMPTDDL